MVLHPRISFPGPLMRGRRLTLFGRSLFLLGTELAANAVCWIVAGLLFGRHQSTRPILSLALLAWVGNETLSLRYSQTDRDDHTTRVLF